MTTSPDPTPPASPTTEATMTDGDIMRMAQHINQKNVADLMRRDEELSRLDAALAAARERTAELESEVERLTKRLEDEEDEHNKTLRQSEFNQQWADRLAFGVGDTSIIGEHSNLNNPWQNALDLMTSAAEVDELKKRIAAPEPDENCPRCDKGIYNGQPCGLCNGSGLMSEAVKEPDAKDRRIAELEAALKPFADEYEQYRAAFVNHLGREPKPGNEMNIFASQPMLPFCRVAAETLNRPTGQE